MVPVRVDGPSLLAVRFTGALGSAGVRVAMRISRDVVGRIGTRWGRLEVLCEVDEHTGLAAGSAPGQRRGSGSLRSLINAALVLLSALFPHNHPVCRNEGC